MFLCLSLENFVTVFEFFGERFDCSHGGFAILDSPQNLKHFQSVFCNLSEPATDRVVISHVLIEDVYVAVSDTDDKD